MDITSLPVMPPGRPASASPQGTRQTASLEAVARADSAAARARANEPRERVVEGELLQRRPLFWQSTRSFIDERNLEKAHPAGQAATSPPQSRLAVTRYISNISPDPASAPTQGRSLDFFV